MSIHQLNFNGKDKVEVAIDRIQTFCPEDGYFLAFSGGKDSVVCKRLCDMANVKYDAHYHVTSVDPPELVYFIREAYPDVIFDIPRDKQGKRISMWTLIPENGSPPMRIQRYCCKELKEVNGRGRFLITGVRWAESVNRKKQHGIVDIKSRGIKHDDFRDNGHGYLILQNDNDESRKMVDTCYKQRKTTLNPIIDWTDAEVWEFIREYNVPYCKLYDEGFKRLGCIGCPVGGAKNQIREFERYPKYKALYLKAFDRMLKRRCEKGRPADKWETPEDVMNWWLDIEHTEATEIWEEAEK